MGPVLAETSLHGLSDALLEKYNTRGPRYTSYPTAPTWTESFTQTDWQNALTQTNQPGQNPMQLSLYTHVPFCESRCLYCGCNVVITRFRDQADKYLDYLTREIAMGADLVDCKRPVAQFHWGGGTPTYLSPAQMTRLFEAYQQHFTFAPHAEIAIEIDPRVTSGEQLTLLKDMGFNRLSLGVQDFDPVVQEAVNRVQPVEMTESMVEDARHMGFPSINFDLIYGLPYQTAVGFDKTLDTVIRMGPDRIALYNYAHVPWLSPHQNKMPESALPSGAEKFQIFKRAMARLTDAGYVYIGMDHFAKPDDELAVALNNGRLHRNFMGYTVFQGQGPRLDTEMLGFGVSAISGLHRYYAQNHKKLSTYYQALDEGTLPIHRGYALSEDDLLHRALILSILCQGELRFSAIQTQFGVDVPRQFKAALDSLAGPTEDGLLLWDADGFRLTPLGRVFSRNIAMAFDAYLAQQAANATKPLFSRTL